MEKKQEKKHPFYLDENGRIRMCAAEIEQMRQHLIAELRMKGCDRAVDYLVSVGSDRKPIHNDDTRRDH